MIVALLTQAVQLLCHTPSGQVSILVQLDKDMVGLLLYGDDHDLLSPCSIIVFLLSLRWSDPGHMVLVSL